MEKSSVEFFLNILISGLSAALAKTIVAPLERVKVILQNQDMSLQVLKGERPMYTGILDVLRRVPREQVPSILLYHFLFLYINLLKGFLSYWRGNGSNVIRYVPTQSLNFAFNDLYKHVLLSMVDDAKRNRTVVIIVNFLGGGMAGISAATVLYPLEFCTTKITADIGTGTTTYSPRHVNKVDREYHGLRHCLHDVHKNAGFKGFYSGLRVGVLSIGVYRSIYFGLFELNKLMFIGKTESGQRKHVPLYLTFLMAQCAVITAAVVCYPFDTVMRRIMIDTGRPKKFMTNHSALVMAKTLYKKKGFRGFYKGVVANCLRCTGGTIVLMMYDEILYFTDWKNVLATREN